MAKPMVAETTIAITAPTMTAKVLLATTAHSLRQIGVRWCRLGAVSASTTGTRPGDLRPARVNAAVALAGLRHPAAIIETIARPAIQAEAVVSSDIDIRDTVPTATTVVGAPRAVHRAWAVPSTVLGFVALMLVLFASVLPSTLRAENEAGDPAEFARVPADAEPVATRLSFDAVERYPADGDFLFVTVREPEITLLDWWIGAQQDEVDLLSREDHLGVQTPEQRRQINVEMMRSAKETAEYVALSYLGYPAEIVPGDVIVAELVCFEANDDGTECIDSAPSDELLDPGDKLLLVDGEELATIEDLGAILQRHQPGDVIAIEFERPGEGTKTGDVELIASGDGTDRTIVGFVPFDTASAELPFEVTIESGSIGGPSAGLAFTLTLIDELTPGELTGGRTVAVTGTINIDGTIGPIGGLVQKTSAVKQGTATVFLVPAAQGEDDIAAARAVAGDDVEIVPVATLADAVQALADRGGNGRDLGQPGADFEPAA